MSDELRTPNMKTDKFLGALNSNKGSYDLELHSVSKEIESPKATTDNEVTQHFLTCRHVVVFIGFFCFFLIAGFRINMSVNIVAMVNHSAVAYQAKVKSDSCPLLLSNSNETDSSGVAEDGEFVWSPQIQGQILGSYFVGYVISLIPAGRLIDRYGCKWFLFAGAFVPAVGTFLMPAFARINPWALVALQLVRGFTQAVVQPAISVLVANWFTRSERGQMYAIIKSGAFIGAFVCSLLSGFLCASSGKWPSSFYATGVIGLMVSFLIIFCVHESPKVHPRISKAELNFILKNQEGKLSKKRPNPPWRKIFTSVPVYALFYAGFGHLWSNAQFQVVHSIFLGTILHFPIAKNGFYSGLTFVLQFVFILVAVYLASLMINRKIAGINFTRKFWNLFFCFGYSACLLGMYFAGCNRSLSVVFGILSAGFSGAGTSGANVSVPEMSPTFAGILNGLFMTIGCMSSVILPLVVGSLMDEKQTIEQWYKVFFISIGVVMSSGIVYSVFGSADVQPWNFVEEENDEKEEKPKTRF